MDSTTLLKQESLMMWQMAKNRYILHMADKYCFQSVVYPILCKLHKCVSALARTLVFYILYR
jgi:hypothetical protein